MAKPILIRTYVVLIFLMIIVIPVHSVTEENCVNSIKEAERQIAERGDYEQAGSNYYSAYKCYEKLGMNGSKYFSLAIEYCTKDYNLTGQYYGALCLGDIYEERGDYDLAIDWFLKSCTGKREKRGDKCGLEYAAIASCYAYKKDKEKTCQWCEKATIESSGFKNYCKTAFVSEGITCGTPVTTSDGIIESDGPASRSLTPESTSNTSQGFPMIYLALGGGIILIVLAALFFITKKKK
jgi:tetratricopeptide (TPR) repeat protein